MLVLGASGTLGATAVQAREAARRAPRDRRRAARRRRARRRPTRSSRSRATTELPQATVVVDGLWGEPAARALAAAAPGVRFVQLGQSAGGAATLESAWVRGKVASILGHSLGSTPPDARAEGYRELCVHARDGRIRFDVETYALDEIAEAWERQSSGSPGVKIVVEL